MGMGGSVNGDKHPKMCYRRRICRRRIHNINMQFYLFTKLIVIGHSIHNLKANPCIRIFSPCPTITLSCIPPNLLSQNCAITNVRSYNPQ